MSKGFESIVFNNDFVSLRIHSSESKD